MEELKLNLNEIAQFQEFTLESYTELLGLLKSQYKIVPFYKVNYESPPYLILRHDVDISLADALEMAQLEKEMGIKSTYFILFSSIFYNLFEGENFKIVKQIAQLGHEIGLHYHPAQYRRYNQDFDLTLQAEVNLLESFTGKKVVSISRHGIWDRDPFALTRHYVNANSPYLRGDLFVHESDRAWTTLDGLSSMLDGSIQRAQLLIHPENWQKNKIGREALLEKHFQELENHIEYLKTDLLDFYRKDVLIEKYESSLKTLSSQRRDYSNLTNKFTQAYWRRLAGYYFTQSKVGWMTQKIVARIKDELHIDSFRN